MSLRDLAGIIDSKCCRRSSATSRCPSHSAKPRAVTPTSLSCAASARPSNKSWHTSRSPQHAASISGGSPERSAAFGFAFASNNLRIGRSQGPAGEASHGRSIAARHAIMSGVSPSKFRESTSALNCRSKATVAKTRSVGGVITAACSRLKPSSSRMSHGFVLSNAFSNRLAPGGSALRTECQSADIPPSSGSWRCQALGIPRLTGGSCSSDATGTDCTWGSASVSGSMKNSFPFGVL
mmetsp:Transcript_66984/g.157946  ORF Transcript_66984/g.157946 Transcript_66984/m.157946 type:complete len:238 (-) Transcript_66984:1436-2149(-)